MGSSDTTSNNHNKSLQESGFSHSLVNVGNYSSKSRENGTTLFKTPGNLNEENGSRKMISITSIKSDTVLSLPVESDKSAFSSCRVIYVDKSYEGKK